MAQADLVNGALDLSPETILVFGHSGQVARELAKLMPEASFVSRSDADLNEPAACAALIHARAPSTVINAAAWTAVDAAEDHRDAAFVVNGAAPEAMAVAAAALDIPFIQISTDYVFDGAGDRPWTPGDQTRPLGAYGASKLAGESGVAAAGGRFGILRTSWVFSAHGANFVKTMLRLSETRDRLTIVADQIGGPTPAAAIADACLRMAEALLEDPGKSGVYHFSGAPDVSWADFARAIFHMSGRKVDVVDICTKDYPTPSARPLNSRLDCGLTRKTFGIERPDWRKHVSAVLKDLETA